MNSETTGAVEIQGDQQGVQHKLQKKINVSIYLIFFKIFIDTAPKNVRCFPTHII